MSVLSEMQNMREQIEVLAKKNMVDNIRVFNSADGGEETPEDDIDILVECLPGCSLFHIADFKADMESLLRRKVHIISDRSINHLLRERIMRDAIKI